MRTLVTGFVLALTVGTLAPANSASAAITCWNNRILLSWGEDLSNPQLVTAEIGWTGDYHGILRARGASAIGPWEKFEICFYDGYRTIKSEANGKYVSAELDWSGSYNGILRARATTVGPWEKFRFGTGAGGSDGLSWLMNVDNGRYASAEFGWTGSWHGTLRARATSAGVWEAYSVSSGS